MNKQEALHYCLKADKELINESLLFCNITYDELLAVMGKDTYNLAKELNKSSTVITKINKLLFPDKIGRSKPCNYVLSENKLKYCHRCSTVKPFKDFGNNSTKFTGKASQCKDCHYEQLLDYQKGNQAKYRAAKLQRTPRWADLKAIKIIYDNCPKGHHVDHIVPLQGKNISGLHVETNLQYLIAKDNLIKSNKHLLS